MQRERKDSAPGWGSQQQRWREGMNIELGQRTTGLVTLNEGGGRGLQSFCLCQLEGRWSCLLR